MAIATYVMEMSATDSLMYTQRHEIGLDVYGRERERERVCATHPHNITQKRYALSINLPLLAEVVAHAPPRPDDAGARRPVEGQARLTSRCSDIVDRDLARGVALHVASQCSHGVRALAGGMTKEAASSRAEAETRRKTRRQTCPRSFDLRAVASAGRTDFIDQPL
ncbi:hypothetical protein EVAR_21083_1 [Eumeta japonica]|uniref:Uncharacterized protein n=1 Tax=Eumeta variegata TaxID=151549 RepID=A0A4C1V0N0_EUMVA|nr:hypothetical protein EVAR_21083_1 [Eumeta japonica]